MGSLGRELKPAPQNSLGLQLQHKCVALINHKAKQEAMAHQQFTMMRTSSTGSSRAAHSTHTHHHKHRHAVKCQAVPTQELAQLAPHLLVLQDAQLAAAAALQSAADLQAGAVATAADAPILPSAYTPGPVEVGWQIWFAAVVSTIPFVIGAYEFGKRIVSVPFDSCPGQRHLPTCPCPWLSLCLCVLVARPFVITLVNLHCCCCFCCAADPEALQGVWRQWAGAARQVPAQVPR